MVVSCNWLLVQNQLHYQVKGSNPKDEFFFLQWHALDRAEQAKYYEMARKEKELHMQLYPGWSARDNYASHTKKKRKKKDGTPNKGIVQTPSILIKYFFLLKAMHIWPSFW